MKMSSHGILSSIMVIGGFLLPVEAAVIEMAAIDAGFVTEAGGSAKGDGTLVASAKYNYSVGRELHYATGALGSPLTAMDRRNYFVFDLAGVTDPITSATLTLWTGSFESVHSSEGYGLFEITDPGTALGLSLALAGATSSTEFDSIGDPLLTAASTLYTKLADGPLFLGGIVLTSADDDSFVDITLTPEGIGYINTFLGGKLVLGGKVPSALPPDSPQQPFGLTGPDIAGGDAKTPMLTLTTVPEPPASVMLGVLCLVGALVRFRRP
ncbi:MAG: hypothetical protein JNL97_10560 [Verrucomicrobiales bacterium]|nr:hypothetical protein [Verrucomicrobiales bacterium]